MPHVPQTRARGVDNRRDVIGNRAKLLAAADDYLAERGLPIAFNELAAFAGAGVGTVYRHFESPEALLDELIDRRVDAVVRVLQQAATIEDPIAGLREAVLGVCELQAVDRSLAQALAGPRFTDVRERLMPLTRLIVERAQASGRMRPEFAGTDFGILLWLGDALYRHAGHVDPRLWRRYVEALLDGLLSTGEPRRPLTVPALDFERMDVVIRHADDPPSRRPTTKPRCTS
ncbi:MAG: TetR/AcrR family transcriptional regulator [Solirubrobacterales bacterium]|nr:TetR/AcrR family transcriptional regulator [Solirubrobacterales bacterium]